MPKAKKKFDIEVANKMRANGASFANVGEHFGMSASYAHKLFNDEGGTAKPPKQDAAAKKSKAGKRKSCRTCHKQKTLNEKNFGNSVKSPDGFMHVCRGCISDIQTKAQADIKKRKAASRISPEAASYHVADGLLLRKRAQKRAPGLEDAQRALALSNTGMPDTDSEALWLLKGVAMVEGITLIELIQQMLTAYRSAKL